MTLFLYLLLTLFVLISIPVLTLVDFLWMNRKSNGPTQELRKIMLIVFAAKFLFYLVEIYVIGLIIAGIDITNYLVMIPPLIAALILCFSNWYAFIKIRKIISS